MLADCDSLTHVKVLDTDIRPMGPFYQQKLANLTLIYGMYK